MQAFLNDPKIKTKYIKRVKAHQKADQIIKGQYWSDGRGCAIGCTIHGDSHKSYETELGIPEELAFLEDGIFENLQIEDALKWPLQFLQAIKPGSDLKRTHNLFLAWLLSEETGILVFENTTRQAILAIRDLHARAASGDIPTDEEWSAAESAAWSAAGSAAGSAAWSAARSAAGSAAGLAARSAAGSAAGLAAYQKMAAKLLELLAAA